MSIEAMKQALEALETPIHEQPFGLTQTAITDLRTAIAEAEKQENSGPINDGWQMSVSDGHSGRGVYAYMTEYPEEGAVFLMPIAEAEKQEPVAWMHPSDEGYDSAFRDHSTVRVCTGNKWEGWIPLYTTPPAAQRQWVGLTDEEVNAFVWNMPYEPGQAEIRAIEAKLKEKNT